jgi:hypothetical protein
VHEAEVTRRLGHVERELVTHSTVLAANAESMKGMLERSDERLEYIRERFDRVEVLINDEREQSEAASRRIVGAATTAFAIVLTAVWFAVIQPIHAEIALLERRLLDVEERTVVLNRHAG